MALLKYNQCGINIWWLIRLWSKEDKFEFIIIGSTRVMTARDTLEYLSNIGMSPHYMKPITLYKNLQFISSECKYAIHNQGLIKKLSSTASRSSLPVCGLQSITINACPKSGTMFKRVESLERGTSSQIRWATASTKLITKALMRKSGRFKKINTVFASRFRSWKTIAKKSLSTSIKNCGFSTKFP